MASLAKAGSLPVVLAFPGQERSIIQVVDANGNVLASTANINGEAVLTNRPTAPYTASHLPVGDQQRFRMTVTTVDTAHGPITAVSGELLERVDGTLHTVRLFLVAGLPVLLAIVAALAWIGTRGALRPVERSVPRWPRSPIRIYTAASLNRAAPTRSLTSLKP